MLPSVGTDSLKVINYGAEVVGRIRGIASMPNLIPEKDRRLALNQSADAIFVSVQVLGNSYVARIGYEIMDSRVTLGTGRGVDKGFDACVSTVSELVRTSLPDRSTSNPDYREIFPDGAEEFTSPTIKEDDGLAATLRQAIEGSSLKVKPDALARLDEIIPVVGPAATAVRDSEKQYNSLFLAEMTARKNVIDAIWEERKTVEKLLGRGGRGLARFIFFDFRSSSPDKADDAPAPAPASPTTPATPEKPK